MHISLPIKPNSPISLKTWTRLELSLFCSIELQTVMEHLLAFSKHFFKIDGISYRHPQHGIELQLGNKSTPIYHHTFTEKGPALNSDITFFKSQPVTKKNIAHIKTMLSLLHLPLCNAIKYFQAIKKTDIDWLTQLHNRTALENIVPQMLSTPQKSKRHHVAIFFIDIDDFKLINDTHGHIFGDDVLKQTTALLKTSSRASDCLFRYGGEEFVLIASNMTKTDAKHYANRIRKRIQSTPCSDQKESIFITISIGITFFKKNDSLPNALDRADKALYQAKASGKNKVSIQA